MGSNETSRRIAELDTAMALERRSKREAARALIELTDERQPGGILAGKDSPAPYDRDMALAELEQAESGDRLAIMAAAREGLVGQLKAEKAQTLALWSLGVSIATALVMAANLIFTHLLPAPPAPPVVVQLLAPTALPAPAAPQGR